MAVKKIKWNQLMSNIDAQDIFDDTEQELIYIDNKINQFSQSYASKPLRDLMKCVDDNFLKSSNSNIWKNLDIYLSSYRENDKRFVLLMKNKLREYLGFYSKILTDTGVQRSLVYAKTYNASGSASSVERGFNSATPQNSSLYDSTHPESDSLFDEAIANYASSIDKNKASSQTSSQGGSRTNVSGVTWEEQKKNLQLLFYNELKDYITSIPERLYSYYCLETIPAPELFKATVDYLIQVMDIVVNE